MIDGLVYPAGSGSQTLNVTYYVRAIKGQGSWASSPVVTPLLILYPTGRDLQVPVLQLIDAVVQDAENKGLPALVPGIENPLGRLHELFQSLPWPPNLGSTLFIRVFIDGPATMSIG